ncbi:O-linked N-acetylglucosamine transferase, SPINDLY family protein [Calothrix sp. FACHB-1219]|uniref:O-linked N-acetylglucosamine transferase, SPINDLY family protein n=1 Tax=unclassified Calothrix TaxID=2619626 RepID=UPI001687961A|nr:MULTISPECIES: O-linked N-acetylglucosamine transferase, SPINDLY family protein [unclassified Calothrix]MBD2201230.1 O-linked N-acetylglucosamine transferase, SPINDLY family protein [Calothrix sp. FACHB-168]MBD2215664.1 O-linked N-acetylglucosamine transferase, SPINDLY family protein [Calothrix sp. FACHB-1219]
MILAKFHVNKNDWQQQAEKYIIEENYSAAISVYEQAIEIQPDVKSHYWYLGLMLLLQGQETEAQMTWLMALSDTEQEEFYIAELLDILETEAERRVSIKDYQIAWAIRQHIKEIAPEDINNLLRILKLSILLNNFSDDSSSLLESITSLFPDKIDNFDVNLLLDLIVELLIFAPTEESVFNFFAACLKYSPEPLTIIDTAMLEVINIAVFKRMPTLASRFAELCLQQAPKHRGVITQLSHFYQNSQQYAKGIETAKLFYEIVTTLAEKVCANSLILRAFMTSGTYWQEVCDRLQEQVLTAKELIQENPDNLDKVTAALLFNSVFFLPYIYDDPQNNHGIQNEISRLSQKNLIKYHSEIALRQNELLLSRKKNISQEKRNLNIGYISHCLKRHSVGWLCRWLFKYHNPEKFKIHSYFLHESSTVEQFTKNNFIDNSYKFHQFGIYDYGIWDQIQSDEIDILVDLDSITLDHSCELMSIKSAPIQVTWLGWDSSGLPSIDYFIADPYVLPESAQDYYSETIWRLPQTYIAVDGFEVDVPNLRREYLDIPSDAIVYFMTQKGYKRHQEHLQLQLRIIAEVPNSYLLIKGDADLESSKEFFERIAEKEGVDFSRLRFLPGAPTEAIHRANLAIADVVLDTYPYNGATTTLETLWMCIPVVTRVGQQFAARNSYTMMMNAGITEGIAWTEDEYVEWGVRLGKDEKLRQQISWKLRQSRQTAPLWNAKQFTRDMEKAYEQMWQRYVDG